MRGQIDYGRQTGGTDMKRRSFLKWAAAGSASAAVTGINAQSAPKPAGPMATQPVRTGELDELSIAQLQEGLKKGRFTAQSLVEGYLRRIEEIDRQGPTLNAVIEINPDAPEIARKLDEERKARGPRSPLHGIPVLIKDNIDTHDRMHTSAGSLALKDSIPEQDSFLAARLRQAGAVILGKTNLSEWANFRSERSTSGWSGRGGLTRNPYALDRNPCGSSSGSAVAVAASLCAVAVGTETDGSIVSPASANGIVGIKPTVGLISRSGIIPISHTQDTAGPMARTVADAAALLGVLKGTDPRDPATIEKTINIPGDYTQFLDLRGLKGIRLGIARRMFGFHLLVDPVMETALAACKSLGAELIDLPGDFSGENFFDAEIDMLLYEFKHDLNQYLGQLPVSTTVRTLKDLIEFNDRHAAQEMPYFGQELFIKAEAKGPLSEAGYRKSLNKSLTYTRIDGIDTVMARHQLDALVAPTMGPVCVSDLILGDRFSGGSSWVAAAAGYPSITVPAGNVYGLPVGISFFGTAWSEPQLIRIAFAFEQGTKLRKKPGFLPTADIRTTALT